MSLVQGRNPLAHKRDLVIEHLHGILKIESLTPRLRDQGLRIRHSEIEIRLLDRLRRLFDLDLNLIRRGIEPHENVPFLHLIVILNEDGRNLPGHPRCDERNVAVHVGVVRGNRVKRVDDPPPAEDQNDQTSQHGCTEYEHAFSVARNAR